MPFLGLAFPTLTFTPWLAVSKAILAFDHRGSFCRQCFQKHDLFNMKTADGPRK